MEELKNIFFQAIQLKIFLIPKVGFGYACGQIKLRKRTQKHRVFAMVGGYFFQIIQRLEKGTTL